MAVPASALCHSSLGLPVLLSRLIAATGTAKIDNAAVAVAHGAPIAFIAPPRTAPAPTPTRMSGTESIADGVCAGAAVRVPMLAIVI